MKKLTTGMTATILIMALIGCSDPAYDPENNETSLEQMVNSLPEDRREEFKGEFAKLVLSPLVDDDSFAIKETDLHGKTTDQIFTMAANLETERSDWEKEQLRLRKEREREQAIIEIQELRDKRTTTENEKANLAKFVCKKSRLIKQEGMFSSGNAIHLEVINGTDHAISRVYFDAVYASPGRSVPWKKDTFNHKISGGLEPGESATWKLSSWDWDSVEIRSKAVFTVTPYKVDDANGEALWGSDRFDEDDATRLQELIGELGDNGA